MSATPAHLQSLEARIEPASTPKPHFLDAIAKRAVLQRLSLLHSGQLTLIDGNRTYEFGKATGAFPITVRVHVHNQRFYSDMAFGGSIGASEAYMQSYWTTDNLTDLIRLFVRNISVTDNLETGTAKLTAPLQKMLHWFNRNTRDGSRKNIAAHYDLGNDFFALWLDPTMMYSSAMFPRADMTLHEAQLARLDSICQKLDLKPTDHLVEIGTGWGGLAIHAARNFGCKVTTTTISKEQFALAKARVEATGLQEQVTVLLCDYRDLQGQYDKLVSIEMIEAVGHQFYDTYFAKCSSLLKPNGMLLLQAITIADHRYEQAKKSVDFIQRYIFPGSCIPSVAAMSDSIARVTDLRLFNLQDIGPHYATTLRMWRENFFAKIDDVKKLGYSDSFIRMWEYYLCYCEGGFEERVLGDVHMLLVKPENRRAAL
jgi:cyclopropane-fatty-acyl-phospholipid synthase